METKQFQKWLNSYSVKMVVVSVLALFLLIPSFLIQDIIKERIKMKASVEEQLKKQWGASQVVSGPVLNVPVTYPLSKDNQQGVTEYTTIVHILPEWLNINAEMIPEIRYRGIYKMPVYESKMKIKGTFSKTDFSKMGIEEHQLRMDDAYFTMGITDLRGITDSVSILVNQSTTAVEPGVSDNDLFQSGITFKPASLDTNQTIDFEIDLRLRGSAGFSLEALGKTTEIEMHSSWANPSFTGSYLPSNRDVNDDGFSASWLVTHLNRNFPQQWTGNKHKTSDSQLGVSFLMPVDHYQKSTRSAKYAILFIALNFIVLFFIEIKNKKRIHPFQYSLVAFALLLFYTLLTSIGEQIGFNAAFVISALAITALISWYSYTILESIKSTLWVTFLQLGLYLFLFTIIQLQDYALLMGSIGLFIILGLIMKASHQVKWYAE